MSSRTILGILAGAVGAALVVGACSDDPTTPVASVTDAAARDVAQRDAPPEQEPGTQPSRATCLDACASTYAGGKSKDDAIASCWTTECASTCTTAGGGSDAGFDAGGADAGACTNPVTTGDLGCDLCTQTRCCAAWDGCFDDDECARYVACVQDCPAQ